MLANREATVPEPMRQFLCDYVKTIVEMKPDSLHMYAVDSEEVGEVVQKEGAADPEVFLEIITTLVKDRF